jgi:hypothetical protein
MGGRCAGGLADSIADAVVNRLQGYAIPAALGEPVGGIESVGHRAGGEQVAVGVKRRRMNCPGW